MIYPLLHSAAINLGPTAKLSYFTEIYLGYMPRNPLDKNWIYTRYQKFDWSFPKDNLVNPYTDNKKCLAIIFNYIKEVFITSVACDQKIIRYYVCEKRSTVIHNAPMSDGTNTSCAPGQFQCNDGSCILDVYLCDGHADCVNYEDEHKLKCQEVLQLSFACGGGQFVPLSFICDGESHCTNGFDEHDCFFENMQHNIVESETTMSETVWCNVSQPNTLSNRSTFVVVGEYDDLVADCPLGEDETQLLELADPQKEALFENRCPGDSYMPCFRGHGKCYHENQKCVFDLNNNGRISICTNGAHLVDCITHVCIDMYKCSESYCIPWQRVCDGSLDFPDGTDEMICKSFVCTGMLKCRNNSVCIHTKEQCDGKQHCLHNDDELQCDLPICPQGCTCLGKSVSCMSAHLVFNPVASSPTLRFLLLSNNSLSNIGHDTFLYPKLHTLDVSYNQIFSLGDSLRNLQVLHTLNLTGNLLVHVQYSWFEMLIVLKVLDLSYNQLKSLNDLLYDSRSIALKYLAKLNVAHNRITRIRGLRKSGKIDILNLSMNPIQFLSFSDEMSIRLVYTDRQLVCCFLKVTRCIYEIDDLLSCKDIPIPFGALISLNVGNFAAVLVNIINIVWVIYTLQGQVSVPLRTDGLFKIHIGISNVLYCCYLLLLASQRFLYDDNTVEYFLSGFSSIPICMAMNVILIVYLVVSPILCIQQIALRCVVLNAMVISLKQKWIYMQIITAWLVASVLASLFLIVSLSGVASISPSLICFPFLNTVQTTTTDQVYLVCVAVYELVGFVALCVMYVRLLQIVYKIKKSTPRAHPVLKNQFRSISLRVSVKVVINLLLLLPFILLLIQKFNTKTTIADDVMAVTVFWLLLARTIMRPVLTM